MSRRSVRIEKSMRLHSCLCDTDIPGTSNDSLFVKAEIKDEISDDDYSPDYLHVVDKDEQLDEFSSNYIETPETMPLLPAARLYKFFVDNGNRRILREDLKSLLVNTGKLTAVELRSCIRKREFFLQEGRSDRITLRIHPERYDRMYITEAGCLKCHPPHKINKRARAEAATEKKVEDLIKVIKMDTEQRQLQDSITRELSRQSRRKNKSPPRIPAEVLMNAHNLNQDHPYHLPLPKQKLGHRTTIPVMQIYKEENQPPVTSVKNTAPPMPLKAPKMEIKEEIDY